MNGQDSFPATPAAQSAQSTPAANEIAELRHAVESQRVIIQAMLVVMVLLLAAFNIFLFHQVRLVRNQAMELQRSTAEMQKTVQEYESSSVPMMQRFTADLQRFAEKDPQFAQILAKYHLPPVTNAPPAKPAGLSPSPSPAPRR